MNTTLVLGATGGIGGAVALEQVRRREPLRILIRDPEKASKRFFDPRRVQAVKGDIFDESTLIPATKDVDLIVFGINFPLVEWENQFPRAVQAVINAAKQCGATIIYPGNTWALGPASKIQYKDDAPNQPVCKLGVIRADMERMLREAAEKSNGRFQVINIRASDYFGPTIRNRLVNRAFGSAVLKEPIKFIGKLSAQHQWAYAPDLARAMLDLAPMRGKFAPYEVINFSGINAVKQEIFLRTIAERAGRATLPIDITSWGMIKMQSLVSKHARALMDLRHLYDGGVLLDGGKFRKLIPTFKDTPAELAIDETIASYRKQLETGEKTDEEESE